MSYGMNGYGGWGKESTWGTPVAPSSGMFFEMMSETLTATIDRFDTRNIFNSLAEPDDTTGLVKIAGDTVIPANAEAIGYLLNAALGSDTVTSLTGALQSHVMQIRSSDISSLCPLQPYTIEIFRDVTSAQQYAGCQASTLKLEVQPNQDLRATATWLGKAVLNKARIAAGSVTFPNTPGQPFTFDSTSLSIAGTAVDIVEGLTININNQLQDVAALNNSTAIARIARTGPVMIDISGNVSFTNINEFNNFLNQTEQAFAVNFFRSQSFSLLINLPRVSYSAFPLAQSGRGRNVVSFTGKAKVPVGSNSQIVATLKNMTAAY